MVLTSNPTHLICQCGVIPAKSISRSNEIDLDARTRRDRKTRLLVGTLMEFFSEHDVTSYTFVMEGTGSQKMNVLPGRRRIVARC